MIHSDLTTTNSKTSKIKGYDSQTMYICICKSKRQRFLSETVLYVDSMCVHVLLSYVISKCRNNTPIHTYIHHSFEEEKWKNQLKL